MFESDEKLVRKILEDKDRQSAEILVEKYYKKIYKEIYLKTSDNELAKDLTQETFIQILKNLHQFDSGKASFKTWIVRIATNKVIDYMRSRQHKELIMTEILEEGYDKADTKDIEHEVVNKEAYEKIDKFLSKEAESDRKIFYLKAEEGYTFDEVSSMTGVTKATVKNRYYAMIRRMRKEFGDYE